LSEHKEKTFLKKPQQVFFAECNTLFIAKRIFQNHLQHLLARKHEQQLRSIKIIFGKDTRLFISTNHLLRKAICHTLENNCVRMSGKYFFKITVKNYLQKLP
jgi:hypothetical protein